MRLGQLSRKLEVDSSEIVKLLQKNFREVNNHPNVKISDEELEFIYKRFAPSSIEIEAVPADLTVVEPEDQTEPALKEEEKSEPIEAKPVFLESLRPKVITLEEEFNEKKKELESYKAEKPELEGLKVIGKIDLPEPKPKTPKAAKEEKPAKGTRTMNEHEARQRNSKNKDGRKQHSRNPVESERRRKEQEEKRRKEQELKWQKEQKKKHYEEHVKAKVADKPKRKRKKKFIEQKAVEAHINQQKKQVQKPSNPLARFWKWLNGGYDKFN